MMRKYLVMVGILALILLGAACSSEIGEPLPTPEVAAPEQPQAPEKPEVEEPRPQAEAQPPELPEDKEPLVDWDSLRRDLPSYATAPELLALVEQESLTTVERERLFALLMDLDWGGLSQYYWDHWDDEEFPRDAANELFTWLYLNQESFSPAEELAVLSATQGIDGWLGEGYAGLVGNIYLKDRAGFFAKVAQLPEERHESAIDLAVSELFWQYLLPENRAYLQDLSLDDPLLEALRLQMIARIELSMEVNDVSE